MPLKKKTIKSKLSKLAADPLGVLVNKLDNYVQILSRKINSVFMFMVSKVRRIKLGDNCSFYGRSYFRRNIGSSMAFGNNCRFRSSLMSNLVGLNRPCIFSTFNEEAQIKVGNNVGFSGTVIGASEYVEIGDNVLCGGNTFITDFDWHSLPYETAATKKKGSDPVIIEDNVWLGLNVIVLKGVKIGRGSVIGANSVVTKSIPENVVAAGNPCKVIFKIR